MSHHLAAQALDHVVGAPRLTPAADKLRRLMHYGQILQSRAHFFHLRRPIFSSVSKSGRRSATSSALPRPIPKRRSRCLACASLAAVGYALTAGKRIHGTGAVPGGVNRSLPACRARRPAGRCRPDHRLEP
ncbi:hypothetical protein [Propionivibrio sp.]|uniref:hypothetical protein n=1 Tax=Propionivibrio sp. TaxID=2212460 RepID=UPI0025F49CDB|nr:hypothetical protein [Propionivibrio sp.]